MDHSEVGSKYFMTQNMQSENHKLQTVLRKNTFFFYDVDAEQSYEFEISAIAKRLLKVKTAIDSGADLVATLAQTITDFEGLIAVLTITGVSQETFLRLITFLRMSENEELIQFINLDEWPRQNTSSIKEWTIKQVERFVRNNEFVATGIAKILARGGELDFVSTNLPSSLVNKISSNESMFETETLLIRLADYKQRGSKSARKENNAEVIIERELREAGIPFEHGDLDELVNHEFSQKRTMDFIIPTKSDPKFIIECSYLVTTSSGMGDKSKTEIAVRKLLKAHYPRAKFFGIVDGIGWYARETDLIRMVSAYDDVFTLETGEIDRLISLLKEELSR